MVKAYGLPAGAKKIGAAGGYVPNFAKYIYDSDRIPADKNATLKAILASSAKKNLIIGPSGAGKSTMAAGMGTFLTGAADVANATEIDILSGAARTKDGGLSKNLESIMAAVNASGGKVSYLYTKNLDILSRRAGRTDPSEGDLRSKKQIAGTSYAPLNQFDFMGMVKSKANSFGMVRGAGGYIPNFANQISQGYEWAGKGQPTIGSRAIEKSILAGRNQLAMFKGQNPEALGWKPLSKEKLNDINLSRANRKTLSAHGKAAMLVPSVPRARLDSAEPKEPDNRDYVSVEFPIYGLSETALKKEKGKNSSIPQFSKAIEEQVYNMGIAFATQLSGSNVSKQIYEEAFAKSYGAKSAIDSLAGGLFETSVRALTYPESVQEKPENRLDFPNLNSAAGQILKRVFEINGLTSKGAEMGADLKGSDSGPIKRKFASQAIQSGFSLEETKLKASGGYIPNFAQGGPLEDAIQREMAAGLDPSQIRVTKDGRLKNSKNPDGFAVINTRDEPDGKVPNFAVRAPAGAIDASGKKIGGRFISQANASSYQEPIKSQGPQKDLEEKSLFTTNKLLAAFTVLTISTQTLQNTVGKTNEGFGKLAAAASQVAAGASGGGLLGSTAKDAFGERLSTLGAFGKGVAKNLPLIGALAGGAFEAYGAYQQNKQAERNVALTGANERINEEVKRIQETSISPEDQNQELQKLAEGKQLAVTNFDSDLKKAKARLSEVQKTRQQSSSNQSFGSKGYISSDEELALYNEEQDLKGKVSALTNTYKGGIQKQALQDEATAAADALKKSTDSIANAAARRTKEEAKATDELRKRLPLEKEFNALSLAISQNQADDSVNSAKRYAQSVASASQLSSTAQEYNNFLLGRNQIQEKINDVEKDSFNTILKQLKSKATSSVDEENLEILIKKLKNGEDLATVEKELANLGLGNLLTNSKEIQDQKAITDEKKIQIRKEEQLYVLNKLSEISIRTQNSLFKDRLSITENAINIETRRRAAAAERETEEQDYNRQLSSRNLEDKVASQPFASNSDKAELLRDRNSLAVYQEKARILKATAQLEQNIETKKVEFANKLIQNETIFSKAQRERFTLQLQKANEEKDGIKRQKMLLALTNDIAKAEYEVAARPTAPTAVDESAFYDPNTGSIDVQAALKAYDEFEKQQDLYKKGTAVFEAGKETRDSTLKTESEKFNQDITQLNKDLETAKGIDAIRIKNLIRVLSYEQKIADLRAKSPAQAGAVRAIDEITESASNFTENFSYNTTLGFRDGLRDALDAAVSGTDDLRGALEGVAKGFLRTMQQAFLQQASNNVMQGLSGAFPSIFQIPKTAAKGGYIQKFAAGGMVTGGSGIRDDVPAMLSSGEYVMRKSAVQKYGAENMAKMNNGGIFLPGVRGGSAISGYDQLSKFANQTTTSGATDVLKGQRSAAFANLEDQSARLSRFGLMNEDTIKGEITSAQQQGLELIAQREAYRTQQRKAMQQQIVGTALSLAISAGTNALGSKGSAPKATGTGAGTKASDLKLLKSTDTSKLFKLDTNSSFMNFTPGKAYGGMIRGFNNGGGPTDDIPALLMGGEYVMDRATVRKYGKQYLDSMNSGRTKFAEGGYAGAETETTTESNDSKAKVDANTGTAVNISINVSGSSSSTESQGQTSQGGVDYKKMSERIKAVVLETLNEEKRLGGSLRTR
jgi:hypothetical protein